MPLRDLAILLPLTVMTDTTFSTAPAVIIDRLVDSWSARHRPESMSTDWGQTLLAYGMLTAVRQTGNANGREYLRRWISYHLSAGVHLTYFVGSWGVGLLYPEVIDEFPEHEHALRELAGRLDELVLHKSLRNGDGVILHNVDLPHIYVDTVYYTAPVLAKLGATLGRNDWQPEAIRQIERHLAILRDRGTPFYIHCEQNLSGHRSEGAWGRGNGWVAMTCAELAAYLPEHTGEYARVSEILRELCAALLAYQTEHGLWRTIINDPDSYEETSASAMFAFAMLRGARFGILGEEYRSAAKRAMNELAKRIDDEGKLMDCSEGTWPGTVAYYKSLGCGEWWWGTGAYLLALAEQAEPIADEG